MGSTSSSDWAPYTVAQGDTLTSIAYTSGVDRDVIWGHEKNKDIASQRKNADILLPTDVVYLPPRPDPQFTTVPAGSTNNFVSPVPNMPIQVQMPDFGGATCTAVADGQTLEPSNVDGEGKLTLSVPVTTQIVEVTFASPDGTVQFLVGHLDPHDTRSGTKQRLTLLGLPVSADAEEHDLRCALALFQILRKLDPTGELDDATASSLQDEHGV
jgi:hypothetical protein